MRAELKGLIVAIIVILILSVGIFGIVGAVRYYGPEARQWRKFKAETQRYRLIAEHHRLQLEIMQLNSEISNLTPTRRKARMEAGRNNGTP